MIDSKVTIEGSTFTGNDANNRGKGGAIYINNNGKGSLTIDDSTRFTKNSAQIGGAIYMNGVKDAVIGASDFSGNGYNGRSYGAQDGGAMYIESQSGATKVTLNGTKFSNNNVYGDNSSSGGAIYIRGGDGWYNRYDDADIFIYGVKFTENSSGSYGGALTVAHDSHAYIEDLESDPTEFKGNTVQYGTDHAGGALFINQGYVILEDSAIYNNYAKDGGGGISSCTKGSAEAKVLDGTAIFDNHVGETFLDGVDPVVEDVDLRGNGNRYPDPEGESPSYPDIYFETKDHLNAETGEIFTDWAGHPAYIIELYERMFNGGVHRWNAKPFGATRAGEPAIPLNSFMAKSNPTNTDISEAKVVFTENIATNLGTETVYTVTGGAIGCNGLLQMGTGTEIKIVKVWDDDRDNDGYRPELDQSFIDNLIVRANGEEIDLSDYVVEIMDINDFDPAALANNIVNVSDPQKDYSDYDAWVIVVSGLRLRDENDELIRYTVGERDIEYYSLIENIGSNETYFEMKNRHEPDLVNISVDKEWADNNDEDGIRPESITVRVMADGDEVAKKEVTAKDDWKVTFKDLPRYNDGEEIEYTIEEDKVDGYEADVEEVKVEEQKAEEEPEAETQPEVIDNDKIEELDTPVVNTEQITVEKGFTLTNTHVPEEEEEGGEEEQEEEQNEEEPEINTSDINVVKEWDDNDDEAGLRPDSITVKLFADGEDTGKVIEITEDEGWKGVFQDLPEGHQYSIKEEDVDGYKAKIVEDGDDYTIVNTFSGGDDEERDDSETDTDDGDTGKTAKKTKIHDVKTGDPTDPAMMMLLASASLIFLTMLSKCRRERTLK